MSGMISGRGALEREVAFKVTIAELVEHEVLSEAEASSILVREESYQALTNGCGKSSDDEALQLYMESLAFRLGLFVLVQGRVESKLKDANSSESLRADLAKARSRLKRVIADEAVKNCYKFKKDKKVDITVMDVLLRLGETRQFDNLIAKLILHNPHQVDYWLLFARRKIAEGDYLAAQASLRKAVRFHPNNRVVVDSLKNVALIVATAEALYTPNASAFMQE
ncbi:hypothetical protein GNI_157050 [Gregarina niphandrodes]|uniref:ER membrane protein complex subunit 2 n=1 Tax=Gregarina niphandrodes TaxID=110365 RepID=A0A023AZZ1_GRENI|nr:hypothetical protein GNI_157050 [Gregarina niphandrodes]EZG43865.1 hypothetical protein GNI_157050 [Gregarina niphandrodes]|eukprot:XP_011132953.1 hypothetical protein GNI_157050 [Gregarina niphandrodes]